MATLKLNNAEVTRAIGQVAGINRDVGEWDTQTKEDARAAIRSGLRRFFSSHDWKFLERQFYMTGISSHSAGTVTVSGGTVTLAGSTWPAWAADGLLRVDGHTLYVTNVVSTTVLTVNNTGVSASAGSSYTLYRWRYPLPDDFGEFVGGVVYQSGNGRGSYLRNVVDTEIRLRHAANFQTTGPTMYAVVAGADDSTVADDDDWYFTFWPLCEANASLSGVIRIVPADNLESDLEAGTTTVQADQVHAETVLAAILACSEDYFNQQPGLWTERFQEAVEKSIKRDKLSQGPVVHEFPNGQQADWRYYMLNHVPTYNDLL